MFYKIPYTSIIKGDFSLKIFAYFAKS